MKQAIPFYRIEEVHHPKPRLAFNQAHIRPE
jgi:hypothetical protein